MSNVEVLTGGYDHIVPTESHTQTFLATHRETSEGWVRPSELNNSFITFNFGGKWVDEFGLIVSFPEGRLQRNLYAQFEDITSDYDIIDGHYYWGTHLNGLTLEFLLVTDGMTEQQLNEFKKYFMPGVTKELYLSESPNKAIQARIAAVPNYSLLPFEHKIKQFFGQSLTTYDSTEYELTTSTTLYKGEINISFISESPFWYARQDSIMSTLNEITPQEIKTIIEDNIPLQDKIMNLPAIYIGDSIYYCTETSRVGLPDLAAEDYLPPQNNQNEEDLGPDKKLYLFYSGTAPSKPRVSFTFSPILNDNTGLIIGPYNKFNDEQIKKYNTLNVGNSSFKFTLPSFYESYNEALMIMRNVSQDGCAATELKQAIREGIHNYNMRKYVFAILKSEITNLVMVDTGTISRIIDKLKFLISYRGNLSTCEISLDFEKGIFTSVISLASVPENTSLENKIEEDASGFIYSDYLIIEDRNILADISLENEVQITIDNCTAITTDCPCVLYDFDIKFKINYL